MVHLLFLAALLCLPSRAEEHWQRPPSEIVQVLEAPDLPSASVAPTGDALLLTQPLRYPPVADLARPFLRLAGVRVDPTNNEVRGAPWIVEASLSAPIRPDAGPVPIPLNGRSISAPRWSADGKRFVFVRRDDTRLPLVIVDVPSGEIHEVPDLSVNPVLGSAVTWMPDQRTLLVKAVDPTRGPAPMAPLVPDGPRVLESLGRGSATSTYETRDVLTSPHAERQFAYYATSRLVLVGEKVTALGAPGILGDVEVSPDGLYILVQRLIPPFSHTVTWERFPCAWEVWNLRGETVHTVATLPLQDHVPIDGVPEGVRSPGWAQNARHTLVWIEALDGGDPSRQAPFRDRILAADPNRAPREIYRAPQRVTGMWWGSKRLLVGEYERERRWRTLTEVWPGRPPRKLFDLSANERYNDPGWPVTQVRPDGAVMLQEEGTSVFFAGDGASPTGDRPFLDRWDLSTLRSERLFRCGMGTYERFLSWLGPSGTTLLTRRESPNEAPNYHVRTLGDVIPAAAGEGVRRLSDLPITHFVDPTPQLRAIQKKIVTYTRDDGTPLSFTLYLPPGTKEGDRLPTIVWAYPLEYSDPGTAGQVSGSEFVFTRLGGASPLFLVLSGYAVLWNTAMPVVGNPDTAYDTFIPQLVADARAAIDKAVSMGVTDPDRVGITGHSHGGLMTATLLAHSDLFRAGVARSGAYNHTLRPFGFQNEHRTLFAARDTYVNLSPTLWAEKINEPLLIVHGEIDQNPGTVPIQSEKLYDAVKGVGGTARLLMLPFEAHGYVSREGVEQVLAEQLAWFDRYVKNAPPR